MVRAPLSKRSNPEAVQEFFALREGVPVGLRDSLALFVETAFYGRISGRGLVVTDQGQRYERIHDRLLPGSPSELDDQFERNDEHLLDAVDFVLGDLTNAPSNRLKVEELELHLAEARSVWKVGRANDESWELQRRQSEELADLAQTAASVSDRAGEHLRRAWSELYGRQPNPNQACNEAVSAIEAAAKPVVSPINGRTTLGTLVSDMGLKPSKWTTDSEADTDLETVIAMMKMVWTGHYRHGDETKKIEVTQEGAEIVVQLATLLVHWFRSGLVSRV